MAHTDRTDELAARGFAPYEPHPDQLDLFGPPAAPLPADLGTSTRAPVPQGPEGDGKRVGVRGRMRQPSADGG
jgi:hypothetical protein